MSFILLKEKDGEVNLKFIHNRRRPYFERQIRPGFSAKRYLSTWTRSWDDSVLEKVISKGKAEDEIRCVFDDTCTLYLIIIMG